MIDEGDVKPSDVLLLKDKIAPMAGPSFSPTEVVGAGLDCTETDLYMWGDQAPADTVGSISAVLRSVPLARAILNLIDPIGDAWFTPPLLGR